MPSRFCASLVSVMVVSAASGDGGRDLCGRGRRRRRRGVAATRGQDDRGDDQTCDLIVARDSRAPPLMAWHDARRRARCAPARAARRRRSPARARAPRSGAGCSRGRRDTSSRPRRTIPRLGEVGCERRHDPVSPGKPRLPRLVELRRRLAESRPTCCCSST